MLPPEIISYIFTLCLPSYTVEPYQLPATICESSRIDLCTSFFLGSICRSWRRIAWATPTLWQTIVLKVIPSPTLVYQVERADGCVARAGEDTPLKLILRSTYCHPPCEVETEEFELVLDFMERHSKRWGSIFSNWSDFLFDSFPWQEDAMNGLKSLNITSPTTRTDIRLDVSLSARNLEEVTLSSFSDSPETTPQLVEPSLKTFTLHNMALPQWIGCIGLAQNLVNLCLKHMSLDQDTTIPAITLPSLRTLDLWVSDPLHNFFEGLTTPVLERLRYDTGNMPYFEIEIHPVPFDIFKDLLDLKAFPKRHSNKLLILSGNDSFYTPELIKPFWESVASRLTILSMRSWSVEMPQLQFELDEALVPWEGASCWDAVAYVLHDAPIVEDPALFKLPQRFSEIIGFPPPEEEVVEEQPEQVADAQVDAVAAADADSAADAVAAEGAEGEGVTESAGGADAPEGAQAIVEGSDDAPVAVEESGDPALPVDAEPTEPAAEVEDVAHVPAVQTVDVSA